MDDHAVFRAGLREWLAGPFPSATFGEAGTGAEARRALASEDWDLVLLDMDLPDATGLEILEWMRAEGVGARALVLTLHAEAPFAQRALRAGAVAYVSKDAAPAELARAVRSALAGEPFVAARVASGLARGLHEDGRAREALAGLSPREVEVLRLLAAGHTVGRAAEVLGVNHRTVSTHRRRLFEKMGWRENREATAYALRHGILGQPEPETTP